MGFYRRKNPVFAVIDGSCLIMEIFSSSIRRGFDRAFSYGTIFTYLKRIFDFLRLNNIIVKYVCIDAMNDADKTDTCVLRKKSRRSDSRKLFESDFSRKSDDSVGVWL